MHLELAQMISSGTRLILNFKSYMKEIRLARLGTPKKRLLRRQKKDEELSR
jgi:hypothetical protein